MLMICKAARDYIKMEAEKNAHVEALGAITERQEKLVQLWGDALTATINEIKAQKQAEGV